MIEEAIAKLKQNFPSFKIYEHKNVQTFIIFEKHDETVLFLRKDLGGFALRAPNKKGGYFLESEVSHKIIKKDIQEIENVIEKIERKNNA